MMKKRLPCIVAALLLLVSFCACGTPPASAPPASVAPSSSAPQSLSTPSQAPGSSAATSAGTGVQSQEGFVTETVGNIRFSYQEGLETNLIDEVLYIYYNDTSFYFVESRPLALPGKETLEQTDAEEYFAAGEQSFNQGNWSDPRRVSEPASVNYNGLDIWLCEIEMNREPGTPFVGSMVVLYHDGMLTSVTMISDVDSYQTSAGAFADTLTTLAPVAV